MNAEEFLDPAPASTLHDAILVVDARHDVVYFDAGAERLFGLPAAEVVGKSVSRLVAADRAAEVHAALRALQQGSAPARVVNGGEPLHARIASGREAWLEGTLVKLVLDNPASPLMLLLHELPEPGARERGPGEREPTALACVTLPIDERLAALMRASSVPLWVKDRQGCYMVASRAYAELLGRKPDELEGHTDAELLPGPVARLVQEHDQAALRAGLPCQQEEGLARDDDRLLLETLRIPIYGVHGLPVAVCGVSTNVAASRRAQLRQAQFAAIVTSTDDGIVGETLEGVITGWNPAAERIYGYSEAEMLGRSIFDLVPPEEQARLHSVMARVAAGETITRERERRVHKDGHLFWVSLTLAPMRDQNGQVMGISAISRDVSQLQEAEELARRLQADLATARERNQAKQAFFGAISHELRSPITAVVGWAELLLDRTSEPLTEGQRQAVEMLLAAANQQRTLLDDMLDLARVEVGAFDVQPELADLGATARMTVDLMAPQAAKAGVYLEVEAPRRGPELAFDRDRVGQVLRNLVGNALKFTPAGGRVEVRVRPDGDTIRCEVTDTGPGIAPADQGRIFEPFSQLDGKHRRAGAGLGLAIAKAIMEAHGGQIGVSSSPGRGSTFWIRLPVAAAAPQPR